MRQLIFIEIGATDDATCQGTIIIFGAEFAAVIVLSE